MRVSTNEDDAGFKNYESGYKYKVTLDGKEVKDAVTADSDMGYVLKAVEPITVVGDSIQYEGLFGKVEISKQLKGESQA